MNPCMKLIAKKNIEELKTQSSSSKWSSIIGVGEFTVWQNQRSRRTNGDVVTLQDLILGEVNLHPNKQNCIRSDNSYNYIIIYSVIYIYGK